MSNVRMTLWTFLQKDFFVGTFCLAPTNATTPSKQIISAVHTISISGTVKV